MGSEMCIRDRTRYTSIKDKAQILYYTNYTIVRAIVTTYEYQISELSQIRDRANNGIDTTEANIPMYLHRAILYNVRPPVRLSACPPAASLSILGI